MKPQKTHPSTANGHSTNAGMTAVLLPLSVMLLLAWAALPVGAQSSYSNAVMNLKPAGYWPLQETNAPAAATMETNYGSLGALGNAYYVATDTNQATLGAAGALTGSGDSDAATSFSGTNINGGCGDYLFVPRVAPQVTIKPPFTLECWFNSTSTVFGDLMGEGGSGLNSPANGGNAGGVRLSYGGNFSGGPNLQMYIFSGSGQYRAQLATPANSLSPGAWHYIAATYDGTTARVYIDGVQQNSGTYSMNVDTWTPLTIGAGFWRNSGYASSWVSGTEDEVALYTNVLSATQVNNHWLAATSSGSNYMQTVLGDNPVLYYRMDASTYTNVPAASCPVAANYGSALVNGAYLSGTRPGVVAGPSVLGVPGEVASPVNGINSAIDAGFDSAFDPTGTQPFTAACWFRGNPADQRPIQALMSQGTNWELTVSGADGTVALVDGAGSVASTGVLNDGNWHFVAGVYDGTNNSLYVDGALNNSAPASGSLAGDAGHDLYLGGNAAYPFIGDASEQYFAGDLAEAAFLTNALTAAQVQGLYSTTTTPPRIAQQPASVNNKAGGQTNVFGVTVTGGAPLVYQWYFNTTSNYGGASALGDGATGSGSVVSGATTATLTISNLQDSDSGYYYMTVTNNYGSVTSLISKLQVFTAPSILSQSPSSDFSVYVGHNYTLSVTAKGALPLSYQWFTNGVADTAAGAGSSYVLTGVTLGMSGMTFQCVVTNDLGSATNLLVTMTVIPLPTTPYATNIFGLNAVGYWPLQETNAPAAATIETNYGSLGTLGTAYYASSSSAQAALGVSGALTPSGDNDAAAHFLGQSTSWMFVPRVSPLTHVQPPCTIEFWYNSSSTAFYDIMGQGGSGLNNLPNAGNAGGFRISYGGNMAGGPNLQLYVFTGVGQNRPSLQLPANTLPLGQWNHCVITMDGTLASFSATMYVNGVNKGSKTFSMGTDTWSPLAIGGGWWRNYGASSHGNGTLDEVAVYTNVLTGTQINDHYLAATTTGSNYMQTVLNDGPLLYYRMDFPNYTNVAAASCPVAANYGSAPLNGAYLSGTSPGAVAGPLVNATVADVASPINGVTACIDAGFDAAFDPMGTQPFTAACWFKGNPGDDRIMTLMGQGANWSLDLVGTNGTLVFGNGAGSVTSTNILNDGNWHFAAGTYDGASNELYVDGKLNHSAPAAGSLAGDASHDLYLGGNAAFTSVGSNQRYLAGAITEAAFFTNALTAEQVQSLYNDAGVPLSIAQQPVSATIGAGAAFTNTVTIAGGSEPFFYQWYTNGVPVGGATNASLILNPVSAGDTGTNYYVIISNSGGSVTSAVVSLTVYTTPTFIAQSPITYTNLMTLYGATDVGGTNYLGSTPAFSVEAVGGVPLTYLWMTNGVAVDGATNTSFTFTNCPLNGPADFACVISNSYGMATNTWPVSYLPAPMAPFPQAVLAANPIAYWRLNEGPDNGNGNGGVICNDYQSGNNGIYTNVFLANSLEGTGYSPSTDPTETAADFGAWLSTSCDVNSIGTNINFSTPAGSNATLTVAIWANGLGQTQVSQAALIGKGWYNPGEQFFLDEGNTANNYVRFFIRTANQTAYNCNSTVSLAADSNWHFIVGVLDEANTNMCLYVDGALVSRIRVPLGAGLQDYSPPSPFLIGARNGNTAKDISNLAFQFKGLLNDAAIYNYALSAGQVVGQFSAVGGTIAPYFAPPPAATASAGAGATLNIPTMAAGTPPMGYVWTNVTSGGIVAAGVTNKASLNAALNYGNVPLSWNGNQLELIVTNAYGTANASVTLSITNTINTSPTNIVFSVGGGNQLTLSWPVDHIGWRLQTQTNSLSVGISTNWVDVSGSTTTNQVFIPISPANGSVFYRLVYP